MGWSNKFGYKLQEFFQEKPGEQEQSEAPQGRHQASTHAEHAPHTALQV